MAITLEQLRNLAGASVFGRRLKVGQDDFLVGPKDLRRATNVLTSGSTGTTISNYGITGIGLTTLATSTNSSAGTTEVGSVFAMDQPVDGAMKILYATTAHSTGTGLVRTAPATIIATSLGSTFTNVVFTARGQTAKLWGVSTSQWLLVAAAGGTSFQSSN